MSENQIDRTGDLSYCDTMTTEELEEILRLDAEMPEGQESDTDKILYIMEVLAERKRNTSHTGKTALEAYESFKQNYMPETDNVIPTKPTRRMPRWVRALTATAAVIAILLAGSVTAKAFGFNVWKAVVQWTQETFHFGEWGATDERNKLQFDSFQEALEEGNTPSWLVPILLPEEFKLTDITVEQTPFKKVYKAIYINGEKSIIMTIQDHLDKIPIYVEQNEGFSEEYETAGLVCYIFTDVNQMKVQWIIDSYECSISGNVTIEELKMMIDSIEKG